MVFSCAPNSRAKAAAKKQALKQKLAGVAAYHGVSLRLLLVDKQVDAQDVLPHAALGSVHVITYDAKGTTLAELVDLIREAHRQNGAPFLSVAIAQHGADAEGRWEWTTDLTVNLKSVHGAIDQLAPVVEVLAAALSKTKAGKAHIDLLACNLATTCKGLVPALEKMYGIDFRASTDETGNDLSGGDWKMETDNDYDVAADYLDAAKLKEYAETMAKKKPVKVTYTTGPETADGHELVKVYVGRKHVASGTIQYENRAGGAMEVVEHVFPGQLGPGSGQNMPNFEGLGNVTPSNGNGYGHALLACMNHRVINNKARGGGDTMNQARMVGAHSAFLSYSPHRFPLTPDKTRGCQEWTSTYARSKKAVELAGVNLTMVCEVAMKTSMNRFERNAQSVDGAKVTWFQ